MLVFFGAVYYFAFFPSSFIVFTEFLALTTLYVISFRNKHIFSQAYFPLYFFQIIAPILFLLEAQNSGFIGFGFVKAWYLVPAGLSRASGVPSFIVHRYLKFKQKKKYSRY